MNEIGEAIRKGREILLTDEEACQKLDAAEKAIRRAADVGKKSGVFAAVGKKSGVFGLGLGLPFGGGN